MNFPKDIIDTTIKSLEKRIAAMMTTRQGERLRYLHNFSIYYNYKPDITNFSVFAHPNFNV